VIVARSPFSHDAEADDESSLPSPHPESVRAAAITAAIGRNFLFIVAPLKWKENTDKGY
jgi:hypothetical protein